METFTNFFKAYYTRQKTHFISEGYYKTDNYWEEVLKPSNITDEHFIEIEEQLKLKLPKVYKSFYKMHYSENAPDIMGAVDFTFQIPGSFSKILDLSNIPEMQEIDDYDSHAISLIGNPEGANLKYLNEFLFADKYIASRAVLLEQGLIPIEIVQHEWYICFDMKQDQENPPIVLYSISFAKQPKARSDKNWFSNFSSFINCLTDYLKVGHYNNFDKIDPKNNYEIIYDFWNMKK